MFRLKFWLFYLMMITVLPCFSEPDSLSWKMELPAIKISYNSSLIYPGIRFGMESPFKMNRLTRTLKKGEIKSSLRSQFITANISWYHHPQFHDNVYFTLGWILRRTGPKGWFWDLSPEAGLSRTFLGGTTYRVDENGTLLKEKLAGYFYALFSVGGGVGYDFSVMRFHPIQVFYKFNVLTMFPYNSTVYIRPAMELGISYKISGLRFFPMKIREISK